VDPYAFQGIEHEPLGPGFRAFLGRREPDGSTRWASFRLEFARYNSKRSPGQGWKGDLGRMQGLLEHEGRTAATPPKDTLYLSVLAAGQDPARDGIIGEHACWGRTNDENAHIVPWSLHRLEVTAGQ
jgi:hypothetical protein